MLGLSLEEKQEVISILKEKIPKMTRRQLECWILTNLGFTQEECGIILDIKQHTICEHLGNLWDILDKS